MAATLEQLVRIPSQLVEAQLNYLGRVQSALARSPLLDRFGRSLDEVRIALRVVPFEPVRHREEAAQTEHFRPPLATHDDEEPDRKRYAHRIGVRDEREPDHPPKPLSEVELLLQHAVLLADPGGGKTEWLKELARRQAIRSKEELENRTVASAEVVIPVFLRLPEVAKALGRGEEDERDGALRDFLVHTGCLAPSAVLGDAQRVAAAMLMRLVEQRQLPERLVCFVWEQWFPARPAAHAAPLTRRPLVCLDAWDEVRKGRERLARCLKAFAAESVCRIFLTSRIVGYSHRPLPVESVAEGAQRELRICPFEWDDTEKFVSDWFRADPERGRQMIGELCTKISVWGMAGNPLMATLLCMAYSPSAKRDPLPFPLRRGPVYERVLWGLLGEWPRQRGQAMHSLGEEEKKRCAAKLDLLAELAHCFFLQGAERFSGKALEEAMHAYLSSERGDDFYTGEVLRLLGSLTPEQKDQLPFLNDKAKQKWIRNQIIAVLRHELIEQDGMLALDIEDKGESYYGFLHLTFQEYLTACALAHRADYGGWQMIEALVDCKAWVPEWEETLVLLMGRLVDPLPFLELLSDAGRDDFFRHRLCLAARCLPEISISVQEQFRLKKMAVTNNEKPQQITEKIAGDVFNLWWEHRGHDRYFPHIKRSLPAIAQSSPTHLRPAILRHLHDAKDGVRERAAEVLGGMGAAAAQEEVLKALIEVALYDTRYGVSYSAAEALGRMSKAAAQEHALKTLVDVALYDSNYDVCVRAHNALRQMGAAAAQEEVLTALVNELHHADDLVRGNAAAALGAIGAAAAQEEALKTLVEALHHADHMVRYYAAWALGRMGVAATQKEVLRALVNALHDAEKWVRQNACQALGEMGNAAATEPVLTALVEVARHDADDNVRGSAAETLRRIGSAAATEPVLTALVELALHDVDYSVRHYAACALGRMGAAAAQEKVLTALIKALHDTDDWVRHDAAGMLRWIASATVQEECLTVLVKVLNHADYLVRARVADALGQIGAAAAKEEVLMALVEMALHDTVSLVRGSAAAALGKMGVAAKEEVLPVLVKLLHDMDSHVRGQAAFALGVMGLAAAREEIVMALVKLLHDADDHLRYSSAWALGQMGAAAAQEEVVIALVKSLHDAKKQVRCTVAETLRKVMAQGVRIFQKQDGQWRVKTVAELGRSMVS